MQEMQVKPVEIIKQLQQLREEVVMSIKLGDERKIEQYRARFQQLTGKLPR